MSNDTNPTHVANRRFTAAGKQYEPGDRVDASGWKWTRQLESQRYISPCAQPAPAPAPAKKSTAA